MLGRAALCPDGRQGKRQKAEGKKKTGEVSSDGSGPLPFHFTILNANCYLLTVNWQLLEAHMHAQLEEPVLQHVGRTQPRRPGRVRISRAHGVRPAAVEHVVEVEVAAQPDLADGEALGQPDVQLVEVVIAVV